MNHIRFIKLKNFPDRLLASARRRHRGPELGRLILWRAPDVEA